MLLRLVPVLGFGGLCAANVAYTVTSWRRMNGRDEAAAEEFLLSPQEAQRLPLVHRKLLLDEDEVRTVLDALPVMKLEGAGQLSRSADSVIPAESGTWQTTYVHTDGMFQRRFPALLERLRATALEADAENWGIAARAPGPLTVRVIEIHEVGVAGALRHDKHYDAGSCITIDLMLSEESEFTGGTFETLECDGSKTRPEFSRGDVVIFPSHKYHCVQPVRSGLRRVLIMELWFGETRTCPHRCELHWGQCNYSDKAEKWFSRIAHGPPDTPDPW